MAIDLSRVECFLWCWGCRVSVVRCRECIIRWVQRPHRCVKPSSLGAWWIHSLVSESWLWKPSPPSAVMVPHSMCRFRPSKLIGVTNTFQNKPLSSQVWNLDLTPLLFNAESGLLIKLMWRRFHCVSFYMWGDALKLSAFLLLLLQCHPTICSLFGQGVLWLIIIQQHSQ